MKKIARIAAVVLLVLVVAAAAAWAFVVPGELKTIVGFSLWRDGHVRDAGFVDRAPAGTRVYWEEYGAADGSPVVVLHAGLGAVVVMGGQIRPLADDGRRVIAIETRGHGRSTNTAPATTYERMGDAVVAVMDALRVTRADVVGWSDGGIVALDLAQRYPERVGKVVAFGANRSPDGAEPAMLEEFRNAKPDDEMLAPMRDLYERTSPTPERWPQLFEQVRATSTTQPQWSLAQLARIRAPVLLMNGEHDVVRLDHAREMQGAIPGARLEIVPGAPHEVPLKDPGAVNPAMLAFLRSR
jgi:pimeloyl-ACP methyl ester carboxylesterase